MKKAIKSFVLVLVVCAALITLVYSLWNIGYVLLNKHESTEIFEELNQLILPTESETKEDEPVYVEPAEKYGSVKEKNNDFVGWISIPNTNINYPVMQTPDNSEYYLHKNFNKEYSFAGTPFISENAVIGESNNLIIYAHNMNDGTMFHNLRRFREQNFVKENPYIYFDTMNEYGKYKVIAVVHAYAKADSDFQYWKYVNINSEEQFEEFISTAKRKSMISVEETASYGDELITLSTCWDSQNDGRLVVIAKKVERW